MNKTMNRVLIQVRVNQIYRDEAREVLEDIGLDVTTAVEIFLRAVAKERRIPFSLQAVDPHDVYTEQDRLEIQEAAKEIAKGNFITQEDLMKKLKARKS